MPHKTDKEIPVDRLAWSQSKGQHVKENATTKQRPFLRGPVPLGWLEQAASLPGKALHVGVLLWFRSGLEGSKTIRLSTTTRERFGVSRWALSDALERMEEVGLVQVERAAGRLPVVTILD